MDGQMVSQMVGQMVGQIVSQMVSRTAGRLVGCGMMVRRTGGHECELPASSKALREFIEL